MALNDPVTGPLIGSSRASTRYMPYIMTMAAIIAVVFLFFGDNISNRTTLPPAIWNVPQTTVPVLTPPATE